MKPTTPSQATTAKEQRSASPHHEGSDTTRPSTRTRARHVALSGRAVFASEIAQAEHHGFRLQVANAPASVVVRLIPQSTKAKTVCHRQGAAMIEAPCFVGSDEQRLDATREAIRVALELARDAGA